MIQLNIHQNTLKTIKKTINPFPSKIHQKTKNVEHTRPIHEQSHQPSQIENPDRSDDQAVRE